MTRTKIFNTLLWLLLVTIALLAVGITFILLIDWNRARPYVNRSVSASIGRPFSIEGNLSLTFVRPAESESGWQRLLPQPQITAEDVRVGNPEWSSVGPQMATAERLVFTIHPLDLLDRNLVLTHLALAKPVIALERRADGVGSWTLKDHGPSAWHVDIKRLEIRDGSLRYKDDGIAMDLKLDASSVASNANAVNEKNPVPRQQYGMSFTLSGNYRNAPVTGGGRAGAVLSLENASTVYPVEAHAQLGQNTVAINGSLTDPRAPSTIDLQLTLGGASMADLYPLTGVLLPETPAYKTTGRLLGKKVDHIWNWVYENFTGTVGGSDLEGTLEYLPRQSHHPRPLLRGAVTSRQLALKDLGPSVGADSNADKTARGKVPVQPEGRALPVEQFNTAKWASLDADVKFNGKHLIRTNGIPFENVVTDIHMADSVLSLAPLNFGMAGGDVTANITLDGRHKTIDAQIKLAARHLKLRELFPRLQSTQASFGEVNGDAALTGHGNSVSAMLANSNGEFAAVASEGSISQYSLELAGLNVANAIFVKIFGDKQIQMNCLSGNFQVDQGDAKIRSFVLDTQDAVVDVSGDVDMAQERLNLDVHPKTKGLRVFSLRTPLYAKGTFSHPDVGPYKGPLILKAGAAAALAALSPAAAILPLINPGKTPNVDCAALLAESNKTRAAPKSEAVAAPAKPVTESQIQKARSEK
ncbi:MAG TPA: AsmA family protein [Methylobacter sp.]|jgi:hypothetical protein